MLESQLVERKEKELKRKEIKDESLPERLWRNIKKHKKLLLAISIVALLIILVHLPRASPIPNQSGGVPAAALGAIAKAKGVGPISMGGTGAVKGMQAKAMQAKAMQAQAMSGDGGGSKGGEGGKKKRGFSTGWGSPLDSGVNVMWWITKNILLFYVFLLFITVVPSLPIILYITIFYFIISGLIGKIQTL